MGAHIDRNLDDAAVYAQMERITKAAKTLEEHRQRLREMQLARAGIVIGNTVVRHTSTGRLGRITQAAFSDVHPTNLRPSIYVNVKTQTGKWSTAERFWGSSWTMTNRTAESSTEC